MKISKVLILAFLSTLIISCGGKKEDENQTNFQDLQERLRQQQLAQSNQHQNTQNKPKSIKTEKGPVTEQLNELYFALRSSQVDMKPLEDGKTIYIKCQGMEMIDEINLCRVGYSKKEIELGKNYINKSHSEDIYHALKSRALGNSMMNNEPLAIRCQGECVISNNLEAVSHQR